MSRSYAAFLARKERAHGELGPQVDPGALHPILHDWQREATAWAIRKGRSALLWDCGLGKSFAQIEWATHSANRTLILAPLSVARQTVREAAKLGREVYYVRDRSQVDGDGVWITNYEMADRFDWSAFGAVVADECFAAGTLVETASGLRPIESIKVGEMVLNAQGVGRVQATAVRRKGVLVRVRVGPRSFICSEHHPWLTERGFIPAKDLQSGERLIWQDEAVRLVRGGLYGAPLLRDILLSEMEDASTGDHRQGSRARGGGHARAVRMVRCVEVLQRGDPEFDRLSGGADTVALYDLEVDGHPSYSVEGLLVHNSSILKNTDGKTRRALTESARSVPLRLACTATPAPNDVAELTNHAEWLGVMSRAEMLAAFFINDEKEWRLKGHAAEPMFRWMATWAHALRSPADMGYPADGYELPSLHILPEVVDVNIDAPEGQLFAADLGGVGGRMKVRRQTVNARVERVAELAEGDDQWIVWCGLNAEADMAEKLIDGAVNVEGNWSPDAKAEALEAFQDGAVRVLVTKPQIAGFGMNFQNCSRMAFVGLNDSYEQYYQAIRRCWRYGQTDPVRAHIVVSGLESQIVENVARKERSARTQTDALIRNMRLRERAMT